MRGVRAVFAALVVVGVVLLAGTTGTGTARPLVATKTCPPEYVLAHLSWGDKCLRDGEFCKVGNPEYHAYGFDCPPDGHLTDWSSGSTTTTPPTTTPTTTTPTTTTPAAGSPVDVGVTVLLARRTRSTNCLLGPNPDRRCSPGAYYSRLTTAVICSAGFHTSQIRNVPESEKFAVESEYGLAPSRYGRTLEIDHIVSLELGGSNDIANLFPEKLNAHPGYRVKDRLENRLHAMVCAGQIGLRVAQRRIAANWEALYKTVYGVSPEG